MEEKLNRAGQYFKWLGILVFIAGAVLAVFEAAGATVIITMGLLSAVQGAVLEYIF